MCMICFTEALSAAPAILVCTICYYKTEVFFSFKNNLKALDPYYKMDLDPSYKMDLWDCFRREKLISKQTS